MEAKRSQFEWREWMLLSTVGWALGFFMGFVLGSLISEDLIPNSVFGEILAYFMSGATLGAVIGLMQWFVLRRQFSRAGWWILASATGFSVVIDAGLALVALMGYSVELSSFASLFRWVLVMAVGGAVTGILQRPVLRQRVSRASWWVLANTLGWALCIFVAGSAGLMLPGLQIVAFFVGGILLGVITGVAMAWLLRQSVPEA